MQVRTVRGVLAGLAIAAGCSAGVAQAAPASFEFDEIADGAAFISTDGPRVGGEGNWNKADEAGTPAVVGDGEGIVVNGITIFAEGSNSLGRRADAFFDSGHAGLGVCSSWSCKSGVPGAITGDDNLNRAEESLTLTFSEAVTLTGLTIMNAIHTPANGSFTFAGSVFDVVNGIVDPAALASVAKTDTFVLEYLPGGPQLYIAKVVVTATPLPASVLLLGAGLAGLGLLRRRGRTGQGPVARA